MKSSTKATIGYKETKAMLDKAFKLIEERGCYVQYNEAPSNSTALAEADEQGIESLIYIHTQADDGFKESGYLYIGHSEVETEWILDIFNSIDGLNADCKNPEQEKILVYPEALNNGAEWKVAEGDEPENKLWNDILDANPDMSPEDVIDAMQSNSDIAEAKTATKH